MLPDQALLDIKIQNAPEAFARQIRAGGDVYWWEKGKFFVVTRMKLAEQVLRGAQYSADRSSFFISRMPNLDLALITDFFAVISKMMVMSDAPEHGARRRVAGMGLTDELLEYYRPLVERTVARLIDEGAASGAFDFVRHVALPVPSVVLADLFHIRDADRMDFYRWSNDMTQFFGGASRYRNEDGILVNRSASSLRDYFVELVARRRREPGGDFLSRMLGHPVGLTDAEIVSQAIMMLVAGQITTTDQLCNNLHTLLTVPGARATLVDRPELLPTALEELNRLDPAVSFLFRVASQPTELGGVSIPEKGVVFVSTHAVNRDPEIFDRPDECVLDRRENPHLAYGYGPHYCLGAKLARLQMQSIFSELLNRFPSVRLDPEAPAVRKHHSLAFSGFERLRLCLEREGASLDRSGKLSSVSPAVSF